MYLKLSPEEISSSLDISPRVLLASKGDNSYAGLVVLIGLIIGHTTMTVFVVLAHLVGCLFFSFFLFFGGEVEGLEVRYTHLLVSARRQTAEIRDLEPGGDGAALFLCLQFSTPRRGPEAENE